MKRLFAWLYGKVTQPIRNKVEIQRRDTVKRLWESHNRNTNRRHRLDYPILCMNIKKTNDDAEQSLKTKLAKWEWLRKLS
jgi:hypothetical protein